MYWENMGTHQDEYEIMFLATEVGKFNFTKKSDSTFYSYYRYYNDGDLPGWVRGHSEYTMYNRHYINNKALNPDGEAELERRADDAVMHEWKRYCKMFHVEGSSIK